LTAWAIKLGKTPVAVLDSPGFIVNRILMPYLYEALVLASQQVPVEVIDQTMRRFGMPWGRWSYSIRSGSTWPAHIARANDVAARQPVAENGTRPRGLPEVF